MAVAYGLNERLGENSLLHNNTNTDLVQRLATETPAAPLNYHDYAIDMNNPRLARGEDPTCNAWRFWQSQNFQPLNCYDKNVLRQIHPNRSGNNALCPLTSNRMAELYSSKTPTFCLP